MSLTLELISHGEKLIELRYLPRTDYRRSTRQCRVSAPIRLASSMLFTKGNADLRFNAESEKHLLGLGLG
jgi:hypothetical protein